MVKLVKKYAFIMPLTPKQFNIGNRYALLKKYKQDKTSGIKINLISREKSVHVKHGEIETTIKHFFLHTKIPSLIKKIIPDEACILTENSIYNDFIIYTTYINNHYPSNIFKITVETSLAERKPTNDFDITYYKYTDLEDQLICYKKLTIEINKFMCGWIAKEIDKNLLEQYVEHHDIIIKTIDEWKSFTYDDIDKLEHEAYGY